MIAVRRHKKKKSLSNNYSVVEFEVDVLDRAEDGGPSSVRNLTLYRGTLVNVNQIINDNYAAIRIVDLEGQYDVSEEDTWLCPREALIHVDKTVWPLLHAVPDPVERVCLLKDSELLDWLSQIDVGSLVSVFDEGGVSTATVQYKGIVPKLGPGIYFGVEVLTGVCEGCNDGSIGKTRYFNCPLGTGMFLPVSRLGPATGGGGGRRTSSPEPPPSTAAQGRSRPTYLPLAPGAAAASSHQQQPPGGGGGRKALSSEATTAAPQARSRLHIPLASSQQQQPPGGGRRSPENCSSAQARSRLHLPLASSQQQPPATSVLSSSVQSAVQQRETDMNCFTTLHSHHTPENLYGCDSSPVGLWSGERVVWPLDDRPLFGTVRSVAYDEGSQLVAEVQFDEEEEAEDEETGGSAQRPAANTVRLPLLELIKATDYFGIREGGGGKTGGWRKETENGDSRTSSKSSQDFLPPLSAPYSCFQDGASSSEDRRRRGRRRSDSQLEPPSGERGELTVGSLVEVTVRGEPAYGVVRWIGETTPAIFSGTETCSPLVGIEMEEEQRGLTDGSLNGCRYFSCGPGRGLFTRLEACRLDSRFYSGGHQQLQSPASAAALSSSGGPLRPTTEDFGVTDCPVISGVIPPLTCEGGVVSQLCGKYRGIQGHHNSCYLDATLFSMFTFTSVFDSLLYRPRSSSDLPAYSQVQRVLREEIVNPLRTKLYVRGDKVMKLRTLMEELSSVSGLTSEEKDPEEFLHSLVSQILRGEPYLKLSSGQTAFHYQLFVEKDEALVFPSVQQLFEQSFLSSDLKLKEVPSCLIIQMPRFGKSFKMYPRIFPSQLLDVTDVIEDSPRQCTVCGNLAEFECKECFQQCDIGLQSISFCALCLETAHSHERRRSHSWTKLRVPSEFLILKEHSAIPRLYMQLFAVVCIETSHYVSFVKCGTGAGAPWCFFDSMADRKGEQNGYNIPEMVACPDLPFWLSEAGAASLGEVRDERQLPEHAKRLLCDAYMCMYQSTEVMMYR